MSHTKIPDFIFSIEDRKHEKSEFIYHPEHGSTDKLLSLIASKSESSQKRFWGLISAIESLFLKLEQDFGNLKTLSCPQYMKNNFAGIYIDCDHPYPIVPLKSLNSDQHPTYLDLASEPEEEWRQTCCLALGIVGHEMGHLIDENRLLKISADQTLTLKQNAEQASSILTGFLKPEETIYKLVNYFIEQPKSPKQLYPDLPDFTDDNKLQCLDMLQERALTLFELADHWLNNSDFKSYEFLMDGDHVCDAFSIAYLPKEINDAYFDSLWLSRWQHGLEKNNLNPLSELNYWASIQTHAKSRGRKELKCINDKISKIYQNYHIIQPALERFYSALCKYFEAVHKFHQLPSTAKALSENELARWLNQ